MKSSEIIAARIVSEIIWDLTDRRGLRQAYEEIDNDIKKRLLGRGG